MMNKTFLFSLLLLTFGFMGRAIDGGDINVMQPGLGQLIWLLSPLVLALVFHFTNREKVRWGFGVRWKESWPYYIFSVLLFPVLFFIIVALGINLGTLNSLQSIYTVSFFAAVVTAIPTQFVKNIFEESVWRGYLFSSLERQGVRGWRNDLVVGLIWSLWHLPYLDAYTGMYHNRSWTIYLPLFIIGVIVTAFVYGALRRRAKSLWPAVILHTMANAFVNVLFFEKYIELARGKEWCLGPTMDNVGYIVLIGLVAYFLIQRTVKG